MSRLYEQLAHLWPLLSPLEDYAADAERILDLIQARLHPKCEQKGDQQGGQAGEQQGDQAGKDSSERVLDIVELGAGGGHTLFYLAQEKHRCTGIDLSDAMLENSRHINPDVQHIVADMRTFQLDQQFDVVLIHDAIDYLTNEADIAATFAASARHLKPGGLLIVAPTYITESFVSGESMEDEYGDDATEVRFVSRVSAVAGKANHIEMKLTIFIRDIEAESLTIETDTHLCGLFSRQTWIKAMQDAGFDVEIDYLLADETQNVEDEQPIPTFIGTKR